MGESFEARSSSVDVMHSLLASKWLFKKVSFNIYLITIHLLPSKKDRYKATLLNKHELAFSKDKLTELTYPGQQEKNKLLQ